MELGWNAVRQVRNSCTRAAGTRTAGPHNKQCTTSSESRASPGKAYRRAAPLPALLADVPANISSAICIPCCVAEAPRPRRTAGPGEEPPRHPSLPDWSGPAGLGAGLGARDAGTQAVSLAGSFAPPAHFTCCAADLDLAATERRAPGPEALGAPGPPGQLTRSTGWGGSAGGQRILAASRCARCAMRAAGRTGGEPVGACRPRRPRSAVTACPPQRCCAAAARPERAPACAWVRCRQRVRPDRSAATQPLHDAARESKDRGPSGPP